VIFAVCWSFCVFLLVRLDLTLSTSLTSVCLCLSGCVYLSWLHLSVLFVSVCLVCVCLCVCACPAFLVLRTCHSEIQPMLCFSCRIRRKKGILYVEVPCPIMGVLHDNFCAFAWGISTPNNSTSDLETATSVVHVVRLRASYMEQMQLFSRGTLLYICSTFVLVPQNTHTYHGGHQNSDQVQMYPCIIYVVYPQLCCRK
jgi:hypothetical protein